MRPPNTIPAWVRDYVGIPFLDRGRDRDGVDCWGLARLYYAERLGVLLPSLSYTAGMDVSADAAFSAEQGRAWTPREAVECPDVHDLALFSIRGNRWHVGVVVPPFLE